MSNKTVTIPHKISSFCWLDNDEYKHFLANANTLTYKKSREDTAKTINWVGIKYAKDSNIFNRIKANQTGNCSIILKDHTANFINHPTTQLINPAMNEIGRTTLEIINRINFN